MFPVAAVSEEEDAATSTSEAASRSALLSADPSTWSIDDVIHFISQHDVTLGQYAELFQKHVSADCRRYMVDAGIIMHLLFALFTHEKTQVGILTSSVFSCK